MARIVPVILAGGSGTRLWPLSRTLFPKQFLALVDEQSLMQKTLERLDPLACDEPLIICNEDHRFIVAEQLRRCHRRGKIVLEPCGRNTAPAMAVSALLAEDDPLLLVLAADHVIGKPQALVDAIESAIPAAQSGKMVTFGIVPTSPHTGYGYIQRGAAEQGGYQVAQFVEKPNEPTAAAYLADGGYYWNAGIFLVRASQYLKELERYRKDIFDACQLATLAPSQDMDFIRLDAEAFSHCPSESIDYAVMEQTQDALVVPLDAQWNDIGAWSALWEVSAKDEDGNATHGEVMLENCKNSLLRSREKLVVGIGLENLVVVDTPDVLLVADRTQAHQVKHLVETLKAQGRSEVINHRKVYRPWGKYDSIDNGERYQVKHIRVEPGAKLSVQMHHHRAEHWVVVSGTAKVTNGERTFLVTENESTFIPIGVVHALENPGKVPLELIEVQSGSYLGEDDIIRFDDKYGRC